MHPRPPPTCRHPRESAAKAGVRGQRSDIGPLDSLFRGNDDGSGAHIEIFGQALKISPAGDQSTTIFPGFRMLSGSSAFFIAHITSTASPCSAAMYCILP